MPDLGYYSIVNTIMIAKEPTHLLPTTTIWYWYVKKLIETEK